MHGRRTVPYTVHKGNMTFNENGKNTFRLSVNSLHAVEIQMSVAFDELFLARRLLDSYFGIIMAIVSPAAYVVVSLWIDGVSALNHFSIKSLVRAKCPLLKLSIFIARPHHHWSRYGSFDFVEITKDPLECIFSIRTVCQIYPEII